DMEKSSWNLTGSFLSCSGCWGETAHQQSLLSGELCALGSVGPSTTRWGRSSMTTLGAMDHFLVGLEAHSEGRNTHPLL
ncbi:hypothetical protein STEG23_005398, partial [Scotinomys teguina]